MKKGLEKLRDRKGISPVVATVLLVAMVIVIALIIFLWFKSFSQETITKFGGQNIQTICPQVSFSASYAAGQLSVVNNGNVPIYNLALKISSGGNYQTVDVTNLTNGGNWPKTGLRQGGTYISNDLSQTFVGSTQILVIPVLLGSSTNGQATYTCQDQYGEQVALS